MKTSSTKRMLAFWLAVAILGAPTSGAFAAEMATLQPTVQAEESAVPEPVAPTVNINHIKLSKNTVTVNGTAQDSVTAIAYSATEETDSTKIDNKELIWSILNNSNGSGVSIAADTGIITVDAKAKAGDYTITVAPKATTAADVTPEVTKTANLKVEREASKATAIDKVFVNDVDVTGNEITIAAGETRELRATVLDQYDDPYTQQANVTYTVADSDSKKISVSDNKLIVAPEAVADTTTTVTAKCETAQDAGKTFTVKVSKKQSEAVKIEFVDFSQQIPYTGKKIEDPKVKLVGGAAINTNVTYKYEKVTPQNTLLADVGMDSVTDVGTYRVTATYTKDNDTAYVSDTFEVTPAKLTVSGLQAENRPYEAGNKNVTVNNGTLNGILNSDNVTMKSAVGTMQDDSAGTDKAVTISNIILEGDKAENYTVTAPTDVKVTINKIDYTGNISVPSSVLKNKSQSFDIPKEIADLAGVTFELKPQASNGTVVEKAEISGKKLTVKTKAEATGTENVVLTVKSKNHNDFDLTYKLTVTNKIDVSNNIQFDSATFPYDKKSHMLKEPKLNLKPDDIGTNAKWTYTYTKAETKDVADTTKMPEFTEVGVYQVTATYEDDKHFGQQTATLKIEAAAPASSITVTAEQRKSLVDENYKNFSISLRDETNGYVRIRADANDYLDRQKINDTYSEWIGLEITPKVNGSTVNIESLYVSTNGASWNKIAEGTYGNFYLDGVTGYTFYLWYDTDDRDCTDDLYLATDNMGANKFQIHMDFDAYSSSSDSSSGSTSSNTDKVNGDKVSTTTIDKTPSVKGNSATVSISSSALSDALEKNKKESKHEHADKSVIELDVKTSKSVDDTTVAVPVKSLDKISDADTGLSLVTNQGTIQLDHRALSKIVSAADKNEVSISIEEDKSNQYTLMVKDGSNEIIDLGSGEAELTFSYKLKSGEKASDVKVYRVGDGSKTWLSTYGGSTVYAGTGTYAAATGSYITNMNADYNSSKKKVTFATDALGTFLVTTDTLQTGGTSTPGTSYPSYPSYPSNSTFVDVPASRWSAQYINKLASLGVVNGTGGGYFEPTLYVTREEFVKMLAGVAGANVSGYTSQRFPDVSASRWSAPYIAWAVDHGITTGTDGGKFAPTMKITREEMATMIYRYTQSAGKVLPTKNVPTVFSDAHRIDSWAQTPVSVMQQAGIIDGNVVNGRYSFDPKVPATREECAKMLCLLYDLI